MEKEAGGLSQRGLSNGKGTVVGAASGGTELSLEGANVEFCVDFVCGQSNGFARAKCLSTVEKGAQFPVDYGCAC